MVAGIVPVGLAVGVAVGATTAGVAVRDGVGVGVLPGRTVAVAVGGVPVIRDGVIVKVAGPVGVAVTVGVRGSGVTAVAVANGSAVGAMAVGVAITGSSPSIGTGASNWGSGFGATICTVSRYQRKSTGGFLAQPSGPLYSRHQPSSVRFVPGGTSRKIGSKPTVSSRKPSVSRIQIVCGPH